MTKQRYKFLRKAAVSGVAGALLVTCLAEASSAATTSSANRPAVQDVTINVAFASYPAPPKAALSHTNSKER